MIICHKMSLSGVYENIFEASEINSYDGIIEVQSIKKWNGTPCKSFWTAPAQNSKIKLLVCLNLSNIKILSAEDIYLILPCDLHHFHSEFFILITKFAISKIICDQIFDIKIWSHWVGYFKQMSFGFLTLKIGQNMQKIWLQKLTILLESTKTMIFKLQFSKRWSFFLRPSIWF